MARSTKESWLEGPGDLREAEVEDVPVEGETVLVRGLPAAYSAQASSESMEMKQLAGGDSIAKVDQQHMERLQFLHGVIEPKFSEAEVKQLQEKFGPAFKKVIAEIDRLSGLDKDALEKTKARFPQVGRSEDGLHLEAGDASGDRGPDVPVRDGAGDGDVDS